MFFGPDTPSQPWRIKESSCLFVASHDVCTAGAEHQQHQQHMYVVYVPPHAPCPWIGMSAMFGSMAAEVRWLLICSQDLGGTWDSTFASLAPPHHFLPGFLHFIEWELLLGTKFTLRVFAKSIRNTLNYSLLQCYYKLVILPHWISTIISVVYPPFQLNPVGFAKWFFWQKTKSTWKMEKTFWKSKTRAFKWYMVCLSKFLQERYKNLVRSYLVQISPPEKLNNWHLTFHFFIVN